MELIKFKIMEQLIKNCNSNMEVSIKIIKKFFACSSALQSRYLRVFLCPRHFQKDWARPKAIFTAVLKNLMPSIMLSGPQQSALKRLVDPYRVAVNEHKEIVLDFKANFFSGQFLC